MTRQGFVCGEQRGPGRVYYKLRFRHAGRQVVRYVGNDPAVADRVRQEVEELQSLTRSGRALARLDRQARRALRRSKSRLATRLGEAGFAYHGFSVRRKRKGTGAYSNGACAATRPAPADQ